MEYRLFIFNTVLYLNIFFLRGMKAVICKHETTDMLFLLDSSFSMYEKQFRQQLQFVTNVIEHFHIGADNIQVSVLTYNHKVNENLIIYFNSFSNRNELEDAILKIPYVKGGTDTGEAIRYGRTHMFKEEYGGRKKANKVIVVFTDGIFSNPTKTESEARLAKLSEIHVIAVGVGNAPNSKDLKLIASNDDSVFRVDSFDLLPTIVEKLSKETCRDEMDYQNNPTENECKDRPLDVFFLLDNSNSIWSVNFKKMLEFIMDIISKFDLTSTRVGIISYSDDIHLMLSLDNKMSLIELRDHVTNMKQLTGGTETGKAIRYLSSYGFSESKERPEAARVALLFSDGKSRHPIETVKAASEAKKKGIHLISIGIEKESDFKELKEIASKPTDKFMFHVKNFDALDSIKSGLAQKACQVQGEDAYRKTEKEVCSFPNSTDVTFIYDSSTIGVYRSKIIRKSIGGIIKTIDFSSKKIRIGILSKTCSKQKNIFLKDYKQKSEFIKALNEKESDGLSHLLRKYRLKYQKKLPKNSRHHRSIVVVFIDGDLTFLETASKESKRVAFKSDVFVMSVGENISKHHAEKLCVEPSHYLFHTGHYSELPYKMHEMFRSICTT